MFIKIIRSFFTNITVEWDTERVRGRSLREERSDLEVM